jgi:hypothetical protein
LRSGFPRRVTPVTFTEELGGIYHGIGCCDGIALCDKRGAGA